MRCKGSDKEMHHMVWTLLHKDIYSPFDLYKSSEKNS
jgi:hypothetical protein